MEILVDIYGADAGIGVAIDGAIQAAKEVESSIKLVGNADTINEYIKENYKKENVQEISPKLSILQAETFISNNEEPAMAIKVKKDSSIVVAYNYMKEHEQTAFLSAGCTGAVMAGALLKLGRIPGIHRPALTTIIPTKNGKDVVFLDSGANPNAKDLSLLQYALIGKAYSKYVLKKENVKIALLNIGVEEEKGTPDLKEAYKLLKANVPEFVGNVEARNIVDSGYDVIVCDGLQGNIAIKSLEGAVLTIKDEIVSIFKRSLINKIKAFFVKDIVKEAFLRYDYREKGGGVLLGVKKPVVKIHGSSKKLSFFVGIKQADNILKADIIEHIKADLAEMKNNN
ncbi:MAG: phosphate acyltransferase PlsX [Clostridia bacterium]